ncbi:MAG: hypothetical protein R2744_00585 [Bacteroidales bacterium]
METKEIILFVLAAVGVIAIRVARNYSQKKNKKVTPDDGHMKGKSGGGDDDYEPYSGK